MRGCIFDSFGLRETTDFLQIFNSETINAHKLPENIESVSKRIRNFEQAARSTAGNIESSSNHRMIRLEETLKII